MGTDRYIIQVRHKGYTAFTPIAIFKDAVETGVLYNCAMDCVDAHNDVEEAQVWDIITKTVLFSWVRED